MSNEQVERLLNYPLALDQGNETNLRGKLILSQHLQTECSRQAIAHTARLDALPYPALPISGGA
jgi:hypothetical protein